MISRYHAESRDAKSSSSNPDSSSSSDTSKDTTGVVMSRVSALLEAASQRIFA
jgi:hypothetical protein